MITHGILAEIPLFTIYHEIKSQSNKPRTKVNFRDRSK